MALRDKYRVDVVSASEGVWFDQIANSDGSVPRFKLARVGRQNKRYTAALRKLVGKHEVDGVLDTDTFSENEAEQGMLVAFLDTVLVGWENFQPEDDGKNIPFSKEAAATIFGSEEWYDLYFHLSQLARKASAFRAAKRETDLKN
jgi:hypothetical protein